MNAEIKKYANSGDLKSLKYIFVDSLDVDPTFVRYEEEYNYCRSISGLLENHIELTPFKIDKEDWNEAYWTNLKMDLIKNFSDKRMSHMREVAKVLLADKIQRILTERSVSDSGQQVSVSKADSTLKSEYMSVKATAPVRKSKISKAEEQALLLEEKKRKFALENKEIEAREEKENRERTARLEQQQERRQMVAQVRGKSIKKIIGIAVAAFIVAIVVFLLLK